MNATLRLAARALRAHKRRLAGTFLAVLLGVSFLAGTMVLGDTMRANFSTLFADANAGTDAVVRSADVVTASGGTPGGVRAPVDASLATRIAAVPGVAAAEPSITGSGQLTGGNGQPIGGKGPPTTAGNWLADGKLNPYHLVQGRAPQRSGEVVINRGAARTGKLRVGESTLLRTPEPVRVTVVGIAVFGANADGLGPTTFTGMTTADAERYLMPKPGLAASILVRAAPGTTQQQLVQRIRPLLPAQDEAITGAAAAAESTNNISGAFLGTFTALLLVFAGIALLVAMFTIHNTFAIVVAQRTRENALLRALGASRRQVLGATLGEAAVVGLTSSAAGLGGGIGVATGLKTLFHAFGWPLPANGVVVKPLDIAVPLAVGTLVALGSALLPAVRAGSTAPLAALRETEVDRSAVGGAGRRRVLLGVPVLAAGAALTVLGALDGPSVLLAGVGAVLCLAGLVVLGPVASALTVRTVGAPLTRLRGVTGRLARSNAGRNPRRTAATATALMIGVCVVALFTVFGASIKAGMQQTVRQSFAGDLAVGSSGYGAGGAGLSPRLAPTLAALPEVKQAVGLGRGVAVVDGHGVRLDITDPAALAGVVDLGAVSGSAGALGGDGLAVSRTVADQRHWTVGSRLPVSFADGKRQTFTVRAVYANTGVAGDYVMSRQAWSPHQQQASDTLVAVSLRPGVSLSAGKSAVERAVAPFGSPQVQDRDAYSKAAASGIDTMLSMVYLLLVLAVLIALLGIANTLTLAVHERTRELGLLRAVGQTRGQLRAMVRWESVLIAAFGTVGGLGLGGFLGWALVRASDSSGTSVFALPVGQLGLVLAAGVVAGALAALRPARRAARLDVLRAVAAE